nr:MAG TPA: hypothetical protein [Bacteriophage sp.]
MPAGTSDRPQGWREPRAMRGRSGRRPSPLPVHACLAGGWPEPWRTAGGPGGGRA